jgi:hypothetical protein
LSVQPIAEPNRRIVNRTDRNGQSGDLKAIDNLSNTQRRPSRPFRDLSIGASLHMTIQSYNAFRHRDLDRGSLDFGISLQSIFDPFLHVAGRRMRDDFRARIRSR